MKMNITDAYKKATKGPLQMDGNLLCDADESGIARTVDNSHVEGLDLAEDQRTLRMTLEVCRHAFNVLPEVVAALEDAREFILRFDESDPEKLAASKRISDMLDKAASVEIPE